MSKCSFKMPSYLIFFVSLILYIGIQSQKFFFEYWDWRFYDVISPSLQCYFTFQPIITFDKGVFGCIRRSIQFWWKFLIQKINKEHVGANGNFLRYNSWKIQKKSCRSRKKTTNPLNWMLLQDVCGFFGNITSKICRLAWGPSVFICLSTKK